MMQSAVGRGVRLSFEITISFIILSVAFGLLGLLGLALILGALRSFGIS